MPEKTHNLGTMTTIAQAQPTPSKMTSDELKISITLAVVFMLRMLGMFLILPIFALEAAHYPGGDDPFLVGLALGAFGFAQALLQIPLGFASDKYGRKVIILIGLLVFLCGSLWAAQAQSIYTLIGARFLQGMGAISAAITALLADNTREVVRTKAMALIGISIGVTFALSLILAPTLNKALGLNGIFYTMACSALICIVLIAFSLPQSAILNPKLAKTLNFYVSFKEIMGNSSLFRLNAGVFALHAVQMALWLVVPLLLLDSGLEKANHGTAAYLPAVGGSFIIVGGLLFRFERKGYLRGVLLTNILLLALSIGALWLLGGVFKMFFDKFSNHALLYSIVFVLFLFFCAFNALEALQPSLISRFSPPHARGMAMGVYNSVQALGVATGASLGGFLYKTQGAPAVFVLCLGLALVWLLMAWPMPKIAPPT